MTETEIEFGMTELEMARHQARQPIDPTQFEFVPPEPRGVGADWPGPFPRQSYAPGELERFERVRAELDVPLQVARIKPSMPQEHLSVEQYEGLLMKELAMHTENYRVQKNATTDTLARNGYFAKHYKDEIISEVMAEPGRKGELRPVKKIDDAGRKVTEFVGSKRAWMNQYKYPPQVDARGILCVPNPDGSTDDKGVRRFLPTVG